MSSDAARRLSFVLNGKSGSCQVDAVSEAIERIAANYEDAIQIHVLVEGVDIRALVQSALNGGVRCVVGGGGDGTINAVASALVGSDVPLGVLPLGTLNHFAKTLGIPLTPEEAIRNVFEGEERVVDVGEVNGRVFLNNSSIGLYPSIVVAREASEKTGRRKWWAFAVAILQNLKRHRLMHVVLVTDAGRQVARATPFLFIGNNKYETSGLAIGSRTRLDRGRLWLSLAPQAGRLKLLVLAGLAVIGRLKEPHLETMETAAMQLKTRRKRVEVALDGEVIELATPLRFRSVPKALHVIVPATEASKVKVGL
jgi:diacylglycerol kinase family enzyme